MIEIKVRFFGAFRNLGEESGLTLAVPEGLRVSEFKVRLGEVLSERYGTRVDSRLLQESALANEAQVLGSNERIDGSCTVAILPPVCGG
jgi:molybdopterin converting factor small subunit